MRAVQPEGEVRNCTCAGAWERTGVASMTADELVLDIWGLSCHDVLKFADDLIDLALGLGLG